MTDLTGDGIIWQKVAAWFDKASKCRNHLAGREGQRKIERCRISTFPDSFLRVVLILKYSHFAGIAILWSVASTSGKKRWYKKLTAAISLWGLEFWVGCRHHMITFFRCNFFTIHSLPKLNWWSGMMNYASQLVLHLHCWRSVGNNINTVHNFN